MTNIVENANEAGEFITLEDGFVYYWPYRSGAINATQLRELANELDNRNAEYVKELVDFFSKPSKEK